MRINQLTFTRCLAAFFVLFFHYGQYLSYATGYAKVVSLGNTFVSYFFILSGFVLTVAYARKDQAPVSFFTFLWNRVLRIYPLYILSFGLVLLYLLKSYGSVAWRDVWVSFFMVQAWYPETALVINGAGWSLSVEFFFYLTFPFIVNLMFKKWSYLRSWVVCLIFWVLNHLAFHWYFSSGLHQPEWNYFLYFHPIFHFNEFILGMGTGFLFLYIGPKPWPWMDGLAVGLGAIIVVLLYFPIPGFYHNGFLGFVFAPFILALALSQGWLKKLFSWKPLELLGEASYGMYILQAPVYRYLEIALFPLGLKREILFPLFLVVLVVVSVVAFRFIEQPLQKRWKRT